MDCGLVNSWNFGYIEFAPDTLENIFAEERVIPKQFDLHPNYSNPFNPAIRIV